MPTDAEWTAITDYLGGATTAGTSLKNTSLWADYLDLGASGNGDNRSGIAGLPGGVRNDDNGSFVNVGKGGLWWSSSEYDAIKAWYRLLYYGSGEAGRSSVVKGCGLSVRCLRD